MSDISSQELTSLSVRGHLAKERVNNAREERAKGNVSWPSPDSFETTISSDLFARLVDEFFAMRSELSRLRLELAEVRSELAECRKTGKH